MKLKIETIAYFIFILILLFFTCSISKDENDKIIRNDNAIRLTYSNGHYSSQNPAFSPDGNYILFTRFLNGYNIGPSQLMKLELSTKTVTIFTSSPDSDNVNVPGTSWIDHKICWSSDRAGNSDEIYTADDDGTNITQITNHSEAIGYYIEPVFNPTTPDKIIFEYGPSDITPHRIALVEIDKANQVTYLTDGSFDDRLPNYTFDGAKILFQRASTGYDNWQIYTATINFTNLTLENITSIIQPDSHNTDNSWFFNNQYILSSSDYNIYIPNIYAFPIDGSTPVQITFSTSNEDGAPSCSYDGKWITFESHIGEDEDTPSDIWIIETPGKLLE